MDNKTYNMIYDRLGEEKNIYEQFRFASKYKPISFKKVAILGTLGAVALISMCYMQECMVEDLLTKDLKKGVLEKIIEK